MHKKLQLLTFIILIFNISTCISQTTLKLAKKKRTNEIHFSLVDKAPFKNDCMNLETEKERTKCLEKSLRDQILNLTEKQNEYKGEMYVWFTVDKKGNVKDITTKGYPKSIEFESEIKHAVSQLNLSKSTYNRKKVNVRCYTRVFPESFDKK